jgi:hypothetical protein
MKQRLLLILFLIFGVNAGFSATYPFFITMPPPATSYFTRMDGDWTDPNVWSNIECWGVGCSCTPGCPLNANSNVYVCDDVTANCTIDIGSNSSITVVTGGSLYVGIGGSITGTGDFIIENGASVVIDGDLDLSGTGTLLVDGEITVNGDVNMNSGGSSICGTGTINVNGALNGTPCVTLTVNVLPIELLNFSASCNDQNETEFT